MKRAQRKGPKGESGGRKMILGAVSPGYRLPSFHLPWYRRPKAVNSRKVLAGLLAQVLGRVLAQVLAGVFVSVFPQNPACHLLCQHSNQHTHFRQHFCQDFPFQAPVPGRQNLNYTGLSACAKIVFQGTQTYVLMPRSQRREKCTLPSPKENHLENFSGLEEKFPGRWWIQKNPMRKPGKPYLPPKSFLCGLHFFGKEKFCTGAGRCMLSFLSQRSTRNVTLIFS